MLKILVVEDDPDYRDELEEELFAGWSAVDVRFSENLADALAAVRRFRPDLILLDMSFPPRAGEPPALDAGARLIRELEGLHPGAQVVALSGQDRAFAVRMLAERRISDFLFKDLQWTEIRARLRLRIEAALDAKRSALLEQEGEAPDERVLVGVDPRMCAVLQKVDRVAPSDAAVLLLGESGTGKELVARRIHEKSRRSSSVFVAVNCGALDEGLVRSELFGHVKGAFTGAVADRTGKFELAHGGTLFLDEVGELSLSNQVGLLRVLEERTFERVGGTDTLECDVRVIAATNRNLAEMIRKGTFREDLFFRLSVFPIEIPPLRERPGDIRPLAEHWARLLARKLGRRIDGITDEALARLCLHPWPGNVRQLRNAIEYALILETSSRIRPESLPPLIGLQPVSAAAPGFCPGVTYEQALGLAERELLTAALAFCKGDTTLAAQQLDLPLRTLQRRLQLLGIRPGTFKT